VAKADALYVAHTKPFFIDETALGTDEDPHGRLLGATELKVLARDGDRINVRLDGWQMTASDRVFYALQGQRIMQAVLGETAIAQVHRGEPMLDPDTGQEWVEASLDLWIDDSGVSTDLSALWNYSAEAFNTSCGTCHALPEADHYLANQWIGNLNAMRRFTSLDDDQYRLMLAYLQNHAKDVAPDQMEAAQ
jgi:hypothetical protein